MRYRIGETPLDTSQPVHDGLTTFTAVFGLFAGIALVILAIKGRQRWLLFWGSGLVISSVAYLAAIFTGFA